MAQKIQPTSNNMDMDFLSGLGNTINSAPKPVQSAPVQSQPSYSAPQQTAPARESGAVESMVQKVTEETQINFADDDEETFTRSVKNTQIVIRATEEEKRELMAYFMKHGITLSKGLKVAVKYLQEQEKKGNVHFSEIGIY